MRTQLLASFFVAGIPTQTGSKTAFKVGDRCIVTDANKRYKVWRKAVVTIAKNHMSKNGLSPHDGPIQLDITFNMPRPKNHFGTGKNAEKLKESSPFEHTKEPDLDKLLRNTIDGLTGLCFVDDAQVSVIKAGKFYQSVSRYHGADIRVYAL